MGTAAPDLVREVIKTWIAPGLRAAEYKKAHHTWSQECGDLIRVFNVQLGKYNEARAAEFTINLGIFHPGYHESSGAYPLGKTVQEYDCGLRQRIGFLLGRTDKWWKVTPRTKPEKVGAEVAQCIEQHALPWLDRFSGLADCLDEFLERGESFAAAIAAHVLGRPEVRSHLSTAIEQNERLRPAVDEWATRHGYVMHQS